MKEQFVNYEISLKLKELGFDEISRFGTETSLYDKSGNHIFYSNYGFMGSGLGGDYIYAPLWQQTWPFLDDNGVIIGIIFVDNVFKYTLNTDNYVSNGFKDRMSAIKSATENATNYLWNKKSNK